MTAEHFEALSLSEYYLKTVWLMRFADLIALILRKEQIILTHFTGINALC